MQYRMNFVLVALAAVALLVGRAGVARADLIAHWAFDEAFGASTAVDSSGSPIQHNGTVDTSSLIQPTTGQPGKIGNAYLFTGDDNTGGDGGVTVPAGVGGELDTFTVVTLCAWVYMTENTVDYDGIIGKETDSRSYFLRGNTNAHWDTGYGGPSWRNQLMPTDPAPLGGYVNAWHHLATTYSYGGSPDTGTAMLYVDGGWVNTDAACSSGYTHTGIPSIESNLLLGTHFRNRSDEASFPGKLDDLGFWSEVLSDAKIAALANVVGFGTTPGVSGLEAYNLSYMKTLFDVYDAGSGSDTTPDGLTWEYVATTPGTHADGDVWIEGGYYYVKLGSGVRAQIPEPSTLLLLTTGLLGLLAYAWRKRK